MAAGADTMTIARQPGDGPHRLSFPQERMFLLDQIMPGLPAYNVPTLYRVSANLDEEALRSAFDTIVARHEILRTELALVDGEPMQRVREHVPFELTVFDLRDHHPAAREAEAARVLGEIVRSPFDLAADVLLRAALVHVSEDEDLLLVVLQHIGSDHVTGGLLLAELDEAYAAALAGRPAELPELAVQYSDYAEWQRERYHGDLLDELLAYWQDHLKGAPERLELPTDRPRPSAQSYRGSWHELAIPAAEATPLRALAKSEGVSLFMVLLAGFKVLLHRYTGSEDVVVGTPVSGRHYEEIAPLLGFFSNTLALRTDLSGDPTFAELLARVKMTLLGGLAYQELPFEKLVQVLNPERARSHSPIFQVLFGYDRVSGRERTIGGAPARQEPIPGWESARFDLSIIVHDLPDGSLHLHVGYSTDLFDAGTVERLLANLRTLLASAATEPGSPISKLEIVARAQRAQLLEHWCDTDMPYDKRCLHELFGEQAARRPDAVAVIDAETRITYGELERRANQLAHTLIGAGASSGALVGICLERSADLLVALLGVLKSGAAYVPIDPSYPPERQEFMLQDAQIPVLVSQEQLVGSLSGHEARVICLDRDLELIASAPEHAPAIDPDPERPAYVIYTSGSTGRPKGVQVSHRSVANLVAHMRRAPGLTEDDVVANITTPAFDLSVPDWYLPLLTGARLIVIPREASTDGIALADWLARTGVTFMQATPTTWQLLIDGGWGGNAALKIVCGGEALPRPLVGELIARGASLWHMYGPTETTVWSSILELHPDAGAGPPPLGGPIANTTFYVLDAHRQLLPVGIPGELYIGGDGLALGYLNRPELTAERFVANPFGTGRLYRTGDLVRWRADGTLEFSGRIDHQIKLRGYRIELGEIEAVLASHPDVSAAVAAVRELGPGDRRLLAYVVPSGAEVDSDALRRLLKRKLPPFMVPSSFISLETLPVNANGKIDRGALPLPDRAGGPSRSYVPPETPVQEALAELWAEVLGVERVGIDDDFFDLGGHSLLAVKMLARVQDDFGVQLYLGGLFDRATVRALAEVLMLELLGDATDDEVASLLAE
jgi:amino acid adenylation domain-containing protein